MLDEYEKTIKISSPSGATFEFDKVTGLYIHPSGKATRLNEFGEMIQSQKQYHQNGSYLLDLGEVVGRSPTDDIYGKTQVLFTDCQLINVSFLDYQGFDGDQYPVKLMNQEQVDSMINENCL
ncbi:MAG: hypothetical protein R2827_14420 [Bdellovibrionales bacterium]